MSRLPYLSKEELPSSKRHLYDQIAGRRGSIPRPISVLLHSPEVASRVASVGEYLRYEASALPTEVREIAALTTARQLGCQYVWTYHVPLARAAGVREEVINAIRDGEPPRRLLPKEAVFVQYTRELLGDRRVRNATFSGAEHLLGREGITELVVTIGYYALLCYTAAALEVELEEGVEPLLPEAMSP